MLPFEIQIGTTYRDDLGNEFAILFYDHETYVFIGRMGKTSCFGVFDVDGKPASESLLSGLIMPADTWGVYHVSDGDTPLKAALERWVAAGGVVEHRFSDTGWGQSGDSHRLCDKSFLYRAAGCTEDREFPQPKPQMPDRVWGGACTDAGLLAELKAWKDAGGEIEYRYVDKSCHDHWSTRRGGDCSWSGNVFYYRAVGCTAEPAISPPQPPAPQPDWRSKPVTHGDMADYLTFVLTTDIGLSHEKRVNWWQQRAQQDSRP